MHFLCYVVSYIGKWLRIAFMFILKFREFLQNRTRSDIAFCVSKQRHVRIRVQ